VSERVLFSDDCPLSMLNSNTYSQIHDRMLLPTLPLFLTPLLLLLKTLVRLLLLEEVTRHPLSLLPPLPPLHPVQSRSANAYFELDNVAVVLLPSLDSKVRLRTRLANETRQSGQTQTLSNLVQLAEEEPNRNSTHLYITILQLLMIRPAHHQIPFSSNCNFNSKNFEPKRLKARNGYKMNWKF